MQYHTRLRQTKHLFRRLTGLTEEVFDDLLHQLEQAFPLEREKRLTRRKRKRKTGGGRIYDHTLGDRLLMLLLYYRTYQSYAFYGFLFRCDQSTICRNIRELEPMLAGIFRIPEKKVQISDDELLAAFIDGTELPARRPGNGRKQKEYYSGKKKRHTVKHIVVVVQRKKKRGPGTHRREQRIAAVSRASPGSVHDKTMYAQARIVLPAGVRGKADLGFLGTNLELPIKKPKGKELGPKKKAHNRRFSRERVCVEHGIGKMKIWEILCMPFRNAMHRHTLIMKNIAGFHNLMFA
jgi:hypothetical protein